MVLITSQAGRVYLKFSYAAVLQTRATAEGLQGQRLQFGQRGQVKLGLICVRLQRSNKKYRPPHKFKQHAEPSSKAQQITRPLSRMTPLLEPRTRSSLCILYLLYKFDFSKLL